MADERLMSTHHYILRDTVRSSDVYPLWARLSPLSIAGIGMGLGGFVVQSIASSFPSSPFAFAVHSDIGQWVQMINSIGVALIAGVEIAKLVMKERFDARQAARQSAQNGQPMPDSSEAECSKAERVRRRKEGKT